MIKQTKEIKDNHELFIYKYILEVKFQTKYEFISLFRHNFCELCNILDALHTAIWNFNRHNQPSI